MIRARTACKINLTLDVLGRRPDGYHELDSIVHTVALWDEINAPPTPECCLVNLYRAGARMGLHQDRDERDTSAAVIGVSLGDEALFRIGGAARGGKTASVLLASGDVIAFGGTARLAYHGIDRIRPGTSRLVPGGGRLSLTLRRVRT